MKKVVLSNPKIYRDYEIKETYEAGIELRGSEVKSLRSSRGSIVGSYGVFKKNELYLYGFHIPPYQESSYFKTSPERPKKILLHRHQLDRLFGLMTQKKFLIVPIEVYFNERNIAKVKIGVVKRFKKYDKREIIKRREIEHQMRREIKEL